MNPDALCSCGSGKQFKLCCGKTTTMISLKAASTWFLIGLLVSGIAVMAWFMLRDNENDVSQPPAANPAVTIDGTIQQATGTPKHYQYDPVTDKHYVAGNGHDHWHPGQPPSTASTNPLLSQPLANQPDLGQRPKPNIPNPQPNQYDPITDQYWHTGSGNPHWHRGRPPNNPGQ